MKVWKVIKERRDKRLAVQLEEEGRRDQADEDLGRQLEEGNGRDRAAWEAVYGDRDQSKQEADSALETDTCASTRKGSLSAVGIREVRNSGLENIEMSNLGALSGSSRKRSHDGTHCQEHPQVTVRVGAEDELQEIPTGDMTRTNDAGNRNSQAPVGVSLVEPTASSSEISPSADPAVSAVNTGNLLPMKTSYSKGPKIIPLPFRVPDAETESGDDASSIATFAASDHIPVRNSYRMPSGESFRSPPVHLQRNSRNISEEALLVPHIDDEGASSVAATVDGVSTDDEYKDNDLSGNAKSQKSTRSSAENLSQPLGASQEVAWKDFNGLGEFEALESDGRAPAKALQDPKSLESLGHGSSIEEAGEGKRAPSLDLLEAGNDPKYQQSVASELSETRGKQAKLHQNLPANTSKVVMAYRTNEWAKHLEAAESPELDDLTTENGSPGLDVAAGAEPAAPVHIKDLQQTPLTAEPAAILSDQPKTQHTRRSFSATSKDSLVNNQTPHGHKLRHRPSGPNVERSASQLSLYNNQFRKESPNSSQLKLSLSQTSLTSNRGYRNSSTPLTNTPLVESPIAEDVEVSFPARFTPSPMNLMSKRDSMVRNKPSSTSLNRYTPSPFPSLASPSNENLPQQDLVALEEDNIPLSRRKSLLQLQQQQQQLSRPSFASPQPQSSSSNPRASTLSAWRSSLRADLPAQQAAQEKLESRRTEMINAKRRTSNSQQWAQLEADRRESDIDRGMRRGELLDLHREAMRKMQGVANRKL